MRSLFVFLFLSPFSTADTYNEHADCPLDEFYWPVYGGVNNFCKPCYECGVDNKPLEVCEDRCSCTYHEDCPDDAYCGVEWSRKQWLDCRYSVSPYFTFDGKACPSKYSCQSSSDCKEDDYCSFEAGPTSDNLPHCMPCESGCNTLVHRNHTCEEVPIILNANLTMIAMDTVPMCIHTASVRRLVSLVKAPLTVRVHRNAATGL